MSDLAFGEPLNMLENDKYHFTVGLLQDGMNLLGPLSPVPWLVRIGYSLPGVAQNFKNLLGWSAQKLRDRIKVRTLFRCSVLSCLTYLQNEPAKRDVSWVLGESLTRHLISVLGHVVAFESQPRCRSFGKRSTLAPRGLLCSHCRWKVNLV